MNTINVLGMDPSLNNTGLAVCEVDVEHGVLTRVIDLHLASTENRAGKRVRKNSDDLRRAREVLKAAALLIKKHQCRLVMAEVPTGTQSARGSISNGICIGILAAIPRPLIEVSPTEVKLATVGKKTASKQDMIDWAVTAYPNAPWLRRKYKGQMELLKTNEHLADATAAVQAGIETEQFLGMAAILGKTAA